LNRESEQRRLRFVGRDHFELQERGSAGGKQESVSVVSPRLVFRVHAERYQGSRAERQDVGSPNCLPSNAKEHGVKKSKNPRPW
jgi:hypothetical protein